MILIAQAIHAPLSQRICVTKRIIIKSNVPLNLAVYLLLYSRNNCNEKIGYKLFFFRELREVKM